MNRPEQTQPLVSAGVVRFIPGPAERDPQAWSKKTRLQERMLSITTPVVFFVLWELAARLTWLDARFFPAPTRIAAAAMEMIRSGIFFTDLEASVTRVVLGFVLGTFFGVLVALGLGLSRLARAAFDPFLSALYTVPKLALLPLLLLIFGLGEVPTVLLVAMTVFFLVWITCMEAILAIPVSYRETAISFGANGWEMFLHVTWPALLPQLFVAMRLAIGTAVLVIVGIEFVQADKGVGYRIWNSWSLFRADQMYVGICTVALLGYILTSVVRYVGVLALPWVNKRGSGSGH